MLKLEVPHFNQHKEGWCVPACVEMILHYLQGVYGDDITVLTQTKIGSICSTDVDGTFFRKWEALNFEIVKNVPSVEFKLRCNQNPETLLIELNKGLPIIVFLQNGDDSDTPAHAVVITGINKATNTIYYNDPYGEKDTENELGRFEKEWEKDFCGWFLEIDLQEKLEEE